MQKRAVSEVRPPPRAFTQLLQPGRSAVATEVWEIEGSATTQLRVRGAVGGSPKVGVGSVGR